MVPAARLVVIALLPLLPGVAAGQPEPPTAEARAAQILAAPEPDRAAIADRDDIAPADIAKALLAIADEARLKGEFRKSLAAYQAAEAVARRAGAQPEIGLALNGAADSLFRLTDLDRAAAAAEASVQFHERRDDANGTAEAWNTIGSIHFYRGEYEQALDAAEKTRELWMRSGNRRGVGRVLNNAGNIHKALGNLDEAGTHYERALAIFDELGDRRSAVVVTSNIGVTHFTRGDYPRALHYVNRALADAEALGDRAAIAKNVDTLALIYRAQGSYRRALEAFRRSGELRSRLDDRYALAETENNLGLLYFSMGEYQLAIDAYKRGLRTASRAGTARGLVPETLANIGAAAWRLGQHERARANFRESLAIGEREGLKTVSAAGLFALGQLALEGGRYRESGVMFERALRIREDIKDQAGIAETLNGLARLHLARRRIPDALELARRSADVAKRFEQAEVLWESLTLAGIAQRRLARFEAGRRDLLEAIAVVERLRKEAGGSFAGRERFFETKLSPYHELVALSVASGTPEEALTVAERARSRVLADIILGGEGTAMAGLSARERQDEHELRLALRTVNTRLMRERTSASPDEARIRSLEEERQSARTRLETFQGELNARHAGLSLRRGEASPFAVAQASRLIRDETEAILEYVVAEDAIYLFVLARRNGEVALQSYSLAVGRRALTERVRRFRERLASRDLLFAEDARALHDLLLAPAARLLAGRTHLVIVPDGPLWETPFQALQDPQGRYVIQTAAVSFAPSLTILRETLGRAPATRGAPTLLAMGKATFGTKTATPAVLMSDLAPLPEAERQVRRIAAIYGPARSAVYLGDAATEERFKAEAPRHRILHVASHGLFEESNPLYSSVVLTSGANGSAEDGLLEAWEMLDLKLDADLVVLSACETGRGRIASGEGLVGTAWALFAAGAQAAVVSQWKVAASSTTELMTSLHRRLAGGGTDKARTLRQATLDLLQDPRYAHPFYWAPFVLVGNPF